MERVYVYREIIGPAPGDADYMMNPMSPQLDPATQINTFKSYVALIADPSPGSE